MHAFENNLHLLPSAIELLLPSLMGPTGKVKLRKAKERWTKSGNQWID